MYFCFFERPAVSVFAVYLFLRELELDQERERAREREGEKATKLICIPSFRDLDVHVIMSKLQTVALMIQSCEAPRPIARRWM